MLNEPSRQKKLENSSLKNSFFLTPIQRKFLQEKLQKNLRAEYRRRIEIILLADMGQSQSQICAALNCSQETARYWIAKAQTGEIYSWRIIPIGRPYKINAEYLDCLKKLANQSPREYGYVCERWRARWLNEQLTKQFNIHISDRHINRLLKKMGLSLSKKSQNREGRSQQLKRAEGKITIGDLSSISVSKSRNLKLFNKFLLVNS